MIKTTEFLMIAALCGNAMAAREIKVTDYGIQPNSRQNAVLAVQAAIEACGTESAATLVFPKGRYDFWAQHSSEIDYYESNTSDINPKICPIVFKDFTGLSIEGNGSEFVCHGRMQPLTFDNCFDITARNLKIDWDIPLVAQAELLRIEKEYIDLSINKLESPYVIEGGKIFFHGEGWKSDWWGCVEFDAATRIIPQGSGDSPLGGGWNNYRAEELTNGLVRLNYDFKRKPKAGNFLIMRHSNRDHAGIFIRNSKNITFEKINLFTAAGLGFLGQFSENITLKKCAVMPNYKKGRYLCGHADGFQVSNCRGLITVEDCKFEGLMDDPINVHGTSVKAIQIKGDRQVVCQYMHSQSTGMTWGGAGNTVGFIDNKSMATLGTGLVEALTRINRDQFELTFAAPLPTGFKVGSALENLTWSPDFTVRNTWFGSCRARGLLVSTPGKVIIENNDFVSSGAAILIAGDANEWYESGGVRDVLIRDNRFHASCLTSWYQFGEGIISIVPIIPEPSSETFFHRNIRIENNQFDAFDYSVLYALSVDGLSFNNNTIKRDTQYQPWQGRKATLTFERCRAVEVKGNRVADDVLGKNIQVISMDPAEISVAPGQGFSRR